MRSACIHDYSYTGFWKLPVGYILVDGRNAEQKVNLVEQCINLLSSCRVKIISLTFDGFPTNIAMAKSLGCILEPSDVTNIMCSFIVSEQEVVIFPHSAHMLKLVRSKLGEKGSRKYEQPNNFLGLHIKAT